MHDDGVMERIEKADAVFFAGGDQLKYTYYYGGTTFLTTLKQRYIHENIVVAGTSAGAMAMSTPMIYAGNDEVQELFVIRHSSFDILSTFVFRHSSFALEMRPPAAAFGELPILGQSRLSIVSIARLGQ